MLFHGLFQSTSTYRVLFMVLAGLGIILGAAYTLRMVQKIAWGEPSRSNIPGEVALRPVRSLRAETLTLDGVRFLLQ